MQTQIDVLKEQARVLLAARLLILPFADHCGELRMKGSH